MFKSSICLGLATLATAQWAFTVPDGDLGEVAPGNNVRQGDIHNFKWQVGLNNEPVAVLDTDGHASLWITSGLDHSFNKLLAASVDSSGGGTWAWDTGTLLDDVIDLCQGVFIYRIQRPVSSEAATYDWDTDLEVSSVSFRILKRSDPGTTQAAPATSDTASTSTDAAPTTTDAATTTTEVQEPVVQTTLVTQTTVATSFAVESTESTNSSTRESAIADPTTTSEQTGTSTTAASSPTGTTTTVTSSTMATGGSSTADGSSSATTTNTPPASDSGLSVGAKAGIGIGAVAAAALIAIAGLLFYRRTRKVGNAPAQIEGAGGPSPLEKPHMVPTQQREYNGSGWADYPEVAHQQQQYPGASRAEMMGEGHGSGRHELPGAR